MATQEWKIGDRLVHTITSAKATVTEIIKPGNTIIDPIDNKYYKWPYNYAYIVELKDTFFPNSTNCLTTFLIQPVSQFFWKLDKDLSESFIHIKCTWTNPNYYPHKCPYCGSSAYIGLEKVECSMKCKG